MIAASTYVTDNEGIAVYRPDAQHLGQVIFEHINSAETMLFTVREFEEIHSIVRTRLEDFDEPYYWSLHLGATVTTENGDVTRTITRENSHSGDGIGLTRLGLRHVPNVGAQPHHGFLWVR